jgi:outer membrane protein assembly factor BamB
MSLRRAFASGTAALLVATMIGGCSSMPSWMPSIPAPSLDWLTGGRGASNKPGPLPEVSVSASVQVNWTASVGKADPGLAPAVASDAIYAAASDGTLVRLDPATGRSVWRTSASGPLSAGPGAGGDVVAVASGKGEVFAFDRDGKPLWTARVSSEVTSPPLIDGAVVVVVSGDGRIYGLNAADGKTKWVFSRANPPLIVRNHAAGTVSRGGAFIGLPGGRLVAIDIASGNLGWDGIVAIPRGATELERIADVTSRPLVEERQACAAAYQGRVACFDIIRGTLLWSRDIGSLGGIAADDRYLYVTDDKSAVHALDKGTGASIWKQDRLAARRLSGPQVVGDYVAVVDIEGYVHLIARSNGAYVGRAATDGTPPTAQPSAAVGGAVWQSSGGTVYSISAR